MLILRNLPFLFLALVRPASALTLEDSTQQYLSKATQVKAAEEQVSLARGDRWRRFTPNEPQFQYSSLDNNASQSYGVSLPLAFPGKGIAYTALDSAKLEGAKNELAAKRYEAVRVAIQFYTDCAGAKSSADILKETVGDLSTLSNSIQQLYESGHSSQAERIGLELQMRQVQADYQATLDRTKSSCAKLAKALETDEASVSDLDIPDDLPKSILDILGEQTADRARASSSFNLAQANLDLAAWSQLPDINLGVSKNHYLASMASPNGEEWTTTYFLSMNIPIFLFFNEYPEYKRIKAQNRIEKQNAELQILNSSIDEQQAAKEYQRSKNRLKEIQNRDMPLAQTLVDSTFSAYKLGKLGFAELISSRKTLLDIKNQDIQLRLAIINARLRCLNRCDL